MDTSNNADLKLDIPYYRVTARNDVNFKASVNNHEQSDTSLTRVLLAHTEFKRSIAPPEKSSKNFSELCVAEVNAISLFFPGIREEKMLICFAAWLGGCCVFDDILDTLSPHDAEVALLESISIMQYQQEQDPTDIVEDEGKRVQHVVLQLREHCARLLSTGSAKVFFSAICRVFEAHVQESHFLQGRLPNDLHTYMKIRGETIALNPFFELIKCEHLPSTNRQLDSVVEQLQRDISRTAGLQNDLIGLERDMASGERMNAVMVLIRAHASNFENLSEAAFSRYIRRVCREHNHNVDRALRRIIQIQRVHQANDDLSSEYYLMIARHIVLMGETHLRWCSSAKRYRINGE